MVDRQMPDSSIDAFRHHFWASARLIGFCRQLSEEQLHAAGGDGTLGSIYATLQHFVTADGNYRQIITGEFPRHWGWHRDERPVLEELEQRLQDSAAFREEMLASSRNPNELFEHRGPDGSEWQTTLGIVIAQALNHGNHHRAEVCVTLTRLGWAPPDIDGYTYGEATGRRGLRDS
jgi:uncharacterized damage-inducible protein DinB